VLTSPVVLSYDCRQAADAARRLPVPGIATMPTKDEGVVARSGRAR
jgi:hypothetical protein